MKTKLVMGRVAAAVLAFAVSNVALADEQELPNASCASGANTEGGRSYQVKLDTHDGQLVSFQVMEPTNFDCATVANGAHPLMLHGPGYAGGRSTSGFGSYRDSGYTVISWDPRGFGDSTGTVRVMDPEFEGQYYLQILDWAEQNLDYLAWRDEATGDFVARPADATSVAGGVNLVVGSQGGSYGGGYQLMILSVDAKERLDAIAPDITWHDLRNALNPGDVVKTMWDLALAGAGEASGEESMAGPIEDGQDPFIKETLARGAALNEFSRQSLDWFHYHGLGYWCAASGLPSMPYVPYGEDVIPLTDALDGDNVPAAQADGRPGFGAYLVQPADPTTHFAGLDVLLTQGMIDTLFTYNEAWWNFQCLRAAGANVSLYTHNGGHTVPGVQSPDKFPSAAGSCPSSQKAWFDARLLPGGAPYELADTCFALGTDGDSVELAEADVLAPHPAGGNARFTTRAVMPDTPVPNGVSGSVNITGNLGISVPLGTVQADGILAGIPHATLTVASVAGANELALDCETPAAFPMRSGCDSITFVGVAVKTADWPYFALIDDQVKPVRGLGRHDFDLNGIAERLHAGDELALMLYADHPQFFGSLSRDTSIPAVTVSGTVSLPLYALDADGNPDPAASAAAVLSGDDPTPDTDADGVRDPFDQCPGTPAGEAADGQGCSASQRDTDGDGVNDAVDQCPQEAGSVDNQGCPAPAGLSVTLSADTTSGDVTNGPVSVQFTAAAEDGDPNGGVVTYVYYFGDGSDSGATTATTATHSYDKAGEYTVTVVAADENNNSASDAVTVTMTTTVTVNPAPVVVNAQLAVTVDGSEAPVTATFDASGSTVPGSVTYTFDFGDGDSVSGAEPVVTHVYPLAGSYLVTVTVTENGNPANTDSTSAVVDVAPVQRTTAILVVSDNNILAGDTISFDASASIAAPGAQIASYTFDFGDGETSGERTVAALGAAAATVDHVYATAGTYQPKVTVLDSSGQSYSSKLEVRVLPAVDSRGNEPAVPVAGASGGSGSLGWLSLTLLAVFGRRRRAMAA